MKRNNRYLAQLADHKYFLPDSPCRRGHLSKRRTSKGDCLECGFITGKIWKEKNRNEINAKKRDYRKEHVTGTEKHKAAQRKYYADHKERILKLDKTPARRAKRTAIERKRKADKLNATPSWAQQDKIEEFYLLAKYLEELSGEKFHVDHIIPLKGKNICGLHWEENLQILPAIENIKKGNKLMESGECTNLSAISIMKFVGGGITENSTSNN